jgi:AraC-like DNA-binding protein
MHYIDREELGTVTGLNESATGNCGAIQYSSEYGSVEKFTSFSDGADDKRSTCQIVYDCSRERRYFMPSSVPATIHLRSSGIAVEETVHDIEFRMTSSIDPFHEVIHVINGGLSLVLDEPCTKMRIPEGGYTIVPAGVSHRLEDKSGSTVQLLCASDDVIAKSLDRRFIWNRITEDVPWIAVPPTSQQATLLHRSWQSVMRIQDQPCTPDTRLRLMTHFDQCLIALYDLRCGKTEMDASTRIRSILPKIEQQLSHHWSVVGVANYCGLSSRRFSQLFREITGSTFVPWLQERRIKNACRLLATGQQTISSAAFISGFEDISHFYRVFEKLCGRTPRQWILENE